MPYYKARLYFDKYWLTLIYNHARGTVYFYKWNIDSSKGHDYKNTLRIHFSFYIFNYLSLASDKLQSGKRNVMFLIGRKTWNLEADNITT